jgi:hypothetical protein
MIYDQLVAGRVNPYRECGSSPDAFRVVFMPLTRPSLVFVDRAYTLTDNMISDRTPEMHFCISFTFYVPTLLEFHSRNGYFNSAIE